MSVPFRWSIRGQRAATVAVVTLRLEFDREDLQRVRMAGSADPMWELVLSLQLAQSATVPAPLRGWHRSLSSRPVSTDAVRRSLAMLRWLVPPAGSFPDFLTPARLVRELDAGCEAILCTPSRRLTAELGELAAQRRLPGWARRLGRGDRDVVRAMVGAVRDVHDLLVAPHWPAVLASTELDRASRVRALARHGVGALLSGLPGTSSWDGHVLHTRTPGDRTVHLGGRGLVLLPSYFCRGYGFTWTDEELPPVLVYPVQRPGAGNGQAGDVGEVPASLVALLGLTRAGCLRVLRTPCTTTELARRLGVSAGTASKQATVLRDAGLVTSHRRGGSVLHGLTALGAAVLDGALPVA